MVTVDPRETFVQRRTQNFSNPCDDDYQWRKTLYQYLKNVKGYTVFITVIGLWISLFLTTPQIGLGTAFGQTSTGLDFPGSAAVPNSTTMRFKFTNPQNNGLPIYGPGGNGLTYIWRAYPRQQSGYYTAFFWGNDDGQNNLNTFLWTSNGHPPRCRQPGVGCGNPSFRSEFVKNDSAIEFECQHFRIIRYEL